jgi:hypothetical protein
MQKVEKTTVNFDPALRTELQEWAREEDRPLGSLLRRIIGQACEQRRQRQQQSQAA